MAPKAIQPIEEFIYDKTTRPVKRLAGKRLFLTYSCVPLELTHDILLGILKAKLAFNYYLISKELHANGEPHFHVLLESSGRFSIRDQSILDFVYNEKVYHGHYKSARRFKDLAWYCAKEKDYITNFLNFHNGQFLSMQEDLISVIKSDGASAAYSHFIEHYPQHLLRGLNATNGLSMFQTTEQNLQKCHLPNVSNDHSSFSLEEAFQKADSEENTAITPTKEKENLSPFSLEDFRLTPWLQQWINQDCQPMLLLCGEAGAGKTVFCKTLADYYNWNFLVINHMEGIKKLTPKHNAILFDDPTFKDLSGEQLLAFITTDDSKEVRVMHGLVEKPAHLIQMMTMNVDSLKRLAPLLQKRQYKRRLLIENLTSTILFPTINVNVTINNHNHSSIYNNAENIELNSHILSDILKG